MGTPGLELPPEMGPGPDAWPAPTPLPEPLEAGDARAPRGRPLRWAVTVLLPAVAYGAVIAMLADTVGAAHAALALWPLPLLLGTYLGAWLFPEEWARLTARAGGAGPLGLILAAAMVAAYAAYACAGGGATGEGFGLALYFWGGLAALGVAARCHNRAFGAWDGALLLFLWANVEFGVLGPAYAWPQGQGGILALLGATLWTFTYYQNGRAMPGVSVEARMGSFAWREVARSCALVFALTIPLGLASGFIQWHGMDGKAWHTPLSTGIAVFFLTAIPEELLFRALLQNALARWWGKPAAALAVASVLFGLTHLNNGPAPDWRYAVLASLAGWCYGRTWMRTGSVTAAALVHMAVDTLWVTLFRSPVH